MNGDRKIGQCSPKCIEYTKGISYAKFPVVCLRERLEVEGVL